MIVIIDTNVLIDAWQDDSSYSYQIIKAVINNELRAAVSDKIWREYQLILNRLVNNPRHRELINIFLNNLETTTTRSGVKIVKYDPEDDKFLSCALAAKADYIISNDSHLWEIGEYQKIKIVTPKNFWLEYSKINDPTGQANWHDWMNGILKK